MKLPETFQKGGVTKTHSEAIYIVQYNTGKACQTTQTNCGSKHTNQKLATPIGGKIHPAIVTVYPTVGPEPELWYWVRTPHECVLGFKLAKMLDQYGENIVRLFNQ